MAFVTDPPSRVRPASSNGRLAAARPDGSGIRSVLAWTFALFNLARLFGYLPTMWAIHVQRDASQHALLTWLVWAGANATMAGWLYEQNRHRCNSAVLVNAANAALCLATVALIVVYRN